MAICGSNFQCYNGSPLHKFSVLQWLSVAQSFIDTIALLGSKFQCYNGYLWLKISVLQWLSVVPNVSTTMALSGWICQLQWLSLYIFNKETHNTTSSYPQHHSLLTNWKRQLAKTMEMVIGFCSTNRTTSTHNISTTWNKIPLKKA